MSSLNLPVNEFLGLQVREGCRQLMSKEDQGVEVELLLVCLEVSPQLPVTCQLHYNPDRTRHRADTHQLDDVLVVKLLHDI